MTRARMVNEVYTLSTLRAVAFDLEERWVEVQEVPTPDEWAPDVIDIRFELPVSYPEHRPRVYVPAELRLRGQRPGVMAPATSDDEHEWCPLDIGPINWIHEHTLETALTIVLSTLEAESVSPAVSTDDPDDSESPGHVDGGQ